MGFLKPKVPKAPPAPNPALSPIDAIDASDRSDELGPASMSLITTAARGLKRRANTERTSLIGGG